MKGVCSRPRQESKEPPLTVSPRLHVDRTTPGLCSRPPVRSAAPRCPPGGFMEWVSTKHPKAETRNRTLRAAFSMGVSENGTIQSRKKRGGPLIVGYLWCPLSRKATWPPSPAGEEETTENSCQQWSKEGVPKVSWRWTVVLGLALLRDNTCTK